MAVWRWLGYRDSLGHVKGILYASHIINHSKKSKTREERLLETDQRPFAMLRLSASLGAALNLLVQAQVSSIPIVDDNDSLLDIYCRSDITALAKNRAYAQINLNEMTIHQLGQDLFSPFEQRSQRCQMCLRTDSLHKVMERLANPGVRRLVIVEAGSKRVEGIVSLSDVFRFLLG